MQTQGLALSLALSYTLSHHNCVRCSTENIVYTHTNMAMHQHPPPRSLPWRLNVVYGQVLDPGSSEKPGWALHDLGITLFSTVTTGKAAFSSPCGGLLFQMAERRGRYFRVLRSVFTSFWERPRFFWALHVGPTVGSVCCSHTLSSPDIP